MQERLSTPKLPTKAHETMRIAGKLVDADQRIEVRNPYSGDLVGTVAAANAAQVAEAFRIGAAYKPKLTRYERQKILLNTAALLAERREQMAVLITTKSGAPATSTTWPANWRSATTVRCFPAISRPMARPDASIPRASRSGAASPPSPRSIIRST